MENKEKISPSVVIDGHTVYPEGWMWILAFALAGVPWAVEQCKDPEYNLRSKIDDYSKRKHLYFLESEITSLEKRLEEVKRELNHVKRRG